MCPCWPYGSDNGKCDFDRYPCGVCYCRQLRSSDVYTLNNKGDFDEIDFEFVNGKPAVKNSIWLNSYKG